MVDKIIQKIADLDATKKIARMRTILKNIPGVLILGMSRRAPAQSGTKKASLNCLPNSAT